ncbi:MAG: hypothetical protein NUK65_06650, partial [Firmicutes bacterium]|nr:hypothetical protein [Bacillota bacterium]
GTALPEIFKEVRLNDSDSYLFTALDGYSVEIKQEDIQQGLIYLNDAGEVTVMFAGLPKNTTIKGLLSIETVEVDS